MVGLLPQAEVQQAAEEARPVAVVVAADEVAAAADARNNRLFDGY